MEAFRRDVISYATRLVEETLADDPPRLNAFRDLTLHFETNPNYTHDQRKDMLLEIFRGRNDRDITPMYIHILKEQYEAASRLLAPVTQAAILLKLATLCFYIQVRDLCRQRFPVESVYVQLSHEVRLFMRDRITEYQMRARLGQVFLLFPDFPAQVQQRVDRITSLFRAVGGGGGGAAAHYLGVGLPPLQL